MRFGDEDDLQCAQQRMLNLNILEKDEELRCVHIGMSRFIDCEEGICGEDELRCVQSGLSTGADDDGGEIRCVHSGM